MTMTDSPEDNSSNEQILPDESYPVPFEDEYGDDVFYNEREDWLALMAEAGQQRQILTSHLNAASQRIGVILGFTALFLIPLISSDVSMNSSAFIFLSLSCVAATIGLTVLSIFRAPFGKDIDMLIETYEDYDGEVEHDVFNEIVEAIRGLQTRIDFLGGVLFFQILSMGIGILQMVV